MKEINKRLIIIYYAIYALFAIGIVIAHLCLLPMEFRTMFNGLVVDYVNLGGLALILVAVAIFRHKIKRQVDLEYYFKWNLFQMLVIMISGLISIGCYAILRDRTTLFSVLIVFVALILCKPAKYKIQKYFQEQDNDQQ